MAPDGRTKTCSWEIRLKIHFNNCLIESYVRIYYIVYIVYLIFYIFIYLCYYWNNGDVSNENNTIKINIYKTFFFQKNTTDSNNIYNVLNVSSYNLWETKVGPQWIRRYEHPRSVQHAKKGTHLIFTLHIPFPSSINNSEFKATSLHNPMALGFKLWNVVSRAVEPLKIFTGDKSLLVIPLSFSSSPSHSATVSARANNPTYVIYISTHISSMTRYSELRAEDSTHSTSYLLIKSTHK